MKKLAWLTSHWFIGLVMVLCSLAAYSSNHTVLETLRLKTFDVYQNLAPRTTNPQTMAARVSIIDIDDATLEKYGQWPWPRTLVAELVDKLMDYGVLVVGFDIVFAEADRLSPPLLAESIPNLADDMRKLLTNMPSNEDILGNSLKQSRVVIGQVGTHVPSSLTDLPRKVGFAYTGAKPDNWLYQYPGTIRNRPELEKYAKGIGLFSFSPSHDGIVRRVPLMERIGDAIYPSLALEMLRVALGGQDDYFIRNNKEGGIKSIVVKNAGGGAFEVPTTTHAEVWIHFSKYTLDDPLYVSAGAVLDGTAPKAQLANHLAIIGTSAIGLKDIRSTPVGGATPGVEVHAQVLENILASTGLTRPDKAVYLEIGVIALAGLLMIFLVPRLNALVNFLMIGALIGGLIYAAWHFYITEQVLVDASYPTIAVFFTFITLTYLNYMREEKERRAVKDAFGHYVSPDLLEELARDPSKLKLGGEMRELTVLFSDIRGFTTISEQFDAEGLTNFINQFLTPMTNVILQHKGTVDKYMGDAIMAFWNAPATIADHATHAARSAITMLEEVERMNVHMEAQAKTEGRKHIPIAIGIGINTGPCCVGNMGSDMRFDYSALGDDVNLGSRLEGQSKTYGVGTVVGQNSFPLLSQDEFALIEMDLIQVKGKTEPIQVYGLLGGKDIVQKDSFQTLKQKNAAWIDAYRQQNFDKASTLINECEELWPELHTLYTLYRDRIKAFAKTPPPKDWDGVFIATSK